MATISDDPSRADDAGSVVALDDDFTATACIRPYQQMQAVVIVYEYLLQAMCRERERRGLNRGNVRAESS